MTAAARRLYAGRGDRRRALRSLESASAGRVRLMKPFTPVAEAPATDEQLVNALRGGDLSAGDALVARYHEPLMRYLQRLAGGDAEELLQRTWVSVLSNIERFDASAQRGTFKAWVFRIATNKTKDQWRSKKRERAATEGAAYCGGSEAPLPSAPMERAEQERRLERALAELPEGQREVLLLRYYGRLKFVEIAELVGCPLNTALTRAHKALIKLRQIMEQPHGIAA